MNLKSILLILVLVAFTANSSIAQSTRSDKGTFIERKNETWDIIKKEVEEFEKKAPETKKVFMLDFSNINIPKTIAEFKPVWHNEPVMQSWTGTCWAFASTSFLESEVYRLNKKEIK